MKNIIIKIVTLFCLLITSQSHALDFAEAIALAHDNDATFQIAQANYVAALEKQPQSQSALLPDIGLSLYASHTNSRISRVTGTTSITPGESSFVTHGYKLSLSQTLYNKKLFDALDQSDAEVAQALAGFQAAKHEMLVRVATAYFEVLAAEDNLAYSIAEKDAIARQLKQSTNRFNAGFIAITDVKESQAQFDIASAQEIAAENELSNANEELYRLVNTTYDELASLKNNVPLLMPDPEDMDEWQDQAKINNLNLRAATYAVTAAKEAVSGNKAAHYPTLGLNLSHGTDSTDGSTLGLGGRDTDDTTITLNLDIPIYSGGLTTSKHREQIAYLDRARAALDNQKRLTALQTRNAYRGIKAAIAQASAFSKALESTRSASEATQAGFRVGTRTSVDVLLAQREQYKSQRDHLRALYDYILNILELKRSAGTLSEEDVQQINLWFSH